MDSNLVAALALIVSLLSFWLAYKSYKSSQVSQEFEIFEKRGDVFRTLAEEEQLARQLRNVCGTYRMTIFLNPASSELLPILAKFKQVIDDADSSAAKTLEDCRTQREIIMQVDAVRRKLDRSRLMDVLNSSQDSSDRRRSLTQSSLELVNAAFEKMSAAVAVAEGG